MEKASVLLLAFSLICGTTYGASINSRGGLSVGTGDQRYLKLNCSNDPLTPGATDSLQIDATTTRTGTTEVLDIDATIDTTTSSADVPVMTLTATRGAGDIGGTYLIKGDLTIGNAWNNEWSYLYGGTIDTTACMVQNDAAIFYADTPTPDANCREYGIFVQNGYDYAGWFKGLTVIQPSATEYVGLYVDGVTNDVTSSVSTADVMSINAPRDINWNAANLTDIVNVNSVINTKNTEANTSISNYWKAYYGLINNDGAVVHDKAWATFLWMRGGDFYIDDNGTYDTEVDQQMLVQQVGVLATIDNDATWTDSSGGTPSSSMVSYGVKIDVDDTPTLTSGTLYRGTYGIYMDVDANDVGTSSQAFGMYIAGVSGATLNYGIKDVSGAPWETDSDLIFTAAGAGLPYGEIYYMGAGFNTTCTTQNVYVQVLGFAVDGHSNLTTPDHTNDHITIVKTGMYLVQFSMSARAANADGYQFMVKKNNGTVDCTNIMVHRDVATAARVGTGACTGICSLTAGDTIEVWVRNIDTAGRAITIEHITLNVTMIGG